MNSIYGNHPIVAPDADKYGHIKGIISKQRTPSSRSLEAFSADQRVIGPEAGPAIRVKHMLAPTDFSDDSSKAVNYAVHLAQLVGAELTLIHFYDESWRQVRPESVCRYKSMLEEEHRIRNNLYTLRDEIRKIYSRCDAAFYIGSPTREIPKVAKELKADLIVISTHNPQGSSRWIFGSDAERIVSNAPCPVLIFR